MTMDCVKERAGHGYTHPDTGVICMIRCFDCGRENWAPAVASGTCAWCGYSPNPEKGSEEEE